MDRLDVSGSRGILDSRVYKASGQEAVGIRKPCLHVEDVWDPRPGLHRDVGLGLCFPPGLSHPALQAGGQPRVGNNSVLSWSCHIHAALKV